MNFGFKYIALLTVFLGISAGAGYYIFTSITDSNTNDDVSASEATAIVSISVPEKEIGVGEQCTISVIVEPNQAIAGLQFELDFDPSLVYIDGITEGDLLNQDGANTFFNSGMVDNESGTVTQVYGAIISPGHDVSGEGTFAVITLTAGTKEATCPINLSNVIVGDREGNSVPVILKNGDLEINQSGL